MPGKRIHNKEFIFRDLLNTDLTLEEIAFRNNVTRDQVYGIADRTRINLKLRRDLVSRKALIKKMEDELDELRTSIPKDEELLKGYFFPY